MNKLTDINIKIFADGANLDYISNLATNPFFIDGFTTNPSQMRKEGINNYLDFVRKVVNATDKPVSFEVFSDDFDQMVHEAKILSACGKNIYVKIPITNTKGEFTHNVIETLSNEGIPLNITAIFTADQVMAVERVICEDTPTIFSLFCGRIADTGVDPAPLVKECRWILEERRHTEILWASCREVYNIFQADAVGCDIITVPKPILDKLTLIGKDLEEYSRETVQEFWEDGEGSWSEL